MKRLRTAKIVLSSAFLALAASASAACGSETQDPENEAVCIDTKGTQSQDDDVRVPEDKCPVDMDDHDGHGMFIWGFYPFGYAPGMGHGAKSTGKSYSTTKTGIVGKAPAGGSVKGGGGPAKGGSSGG